MNLKDKTEAVAIVRSLYSETIHEVHAPLTSRIQRLHTLLTADESVHAPSSPPEVTNRRTRIGGTHHADLLSFNPDDPQIATMIDMGCLTFERPVFDNLMRGLNTSLARLTETVPRPAIAVLREYVSTVLGDIPYTAVRGGVVSQRFLEKMPLQMSSNGKLAVHVPLAWIEKYKSGGARPQ